MNRGSARRTIFDTRAEYRYFMAEVARAVRRGDLLVLAFALMRTHYHLFVRSRGRMSDAIRRIQLQHARRFNRTHRRDGPLFRGRFKSKLVPDDSYRRNLVRYIDENPVLARICASPSEYPWGSARRFARAEPPRWLCPEVVLRLGLRRSGRVVPDEAAMIARSEFIEARLEGRDAADVFPIDHGTPARVLDWMRYKAGVADGAVSIPPMAGGATIQATLGGFVRAEDMTPVPDGYTQPTRDLLLAGLMRYLAHASYAGIAGKLESTESRAKRLCVQHLRCLRRPEYAQLCGRVVAACVAPLLPQ